ncbi:putative membrane protein [Wickerhamomyces ciferrii]|uniref:Membrane protein n=1 Tax=Wickerhamomyces ciferrii (strain ATCC 14091 / BCRC 22168 / CBS 111 / JCM 3599 / NBRC 0793 / NRRL Y-1031 F-60-10) TaxID=1206466 RepID=K0KPX6_WICCF|nr:uncharacterized protein BN7_3776 [Wickerhamomyces ciferrii]CCH44217.1 putative membrane protein [Wickerhamomyces ciferrii]
MGTCLAVTKIIGTTSLGIFAGYSISNISTYDILIKVLSQSNLIDFAQWNGKINEILVKNSIVLGGLGGISSLLFALSYNSSPSSGKHPYLIYASLVLPISSILIGILGKNEISNYLKLDSLIEKFKQGNTISGDNVKQVKQVITSELDNSVYKDLGDDSVSTTSEQDQDQEPITPEGQNEDDEISKEVEIHLNKTTILNLLNKLNFINKFISGVSVLGFVISSIGIYGDY